MDDLMVPPSAVEAEQSILGSMMLDNRVIDDAVSVLIADDFYRSDHRLIFDTICQMNSKFQACDVVTVAEFCTSNGTLDQVGGLTYLGSLAKNTPNTGNVKTYCKIVKDKSILRSVIQVSNDAIQMAYFPEDLSPEDILDQTDKSMAKVMETSSVGEARHISEFLGAEIDQLEHRFNNKGELVGLPSGIAPLDRQIQGFEKGAMYILAARPGMGKAQPLHSQVLTNNGFVEMGSLSVGDELASVDGSKSVVTGIYPQGSKENYAVTFCDGSVVECCDEHLWKVNNRKWRSPRVLPTSELIKFLEKPSYAKRMYVERFTGDWGVSDLKLDPYVLGVMLGDGSMVRGYARIACPDDHVKNMVESNLPASLSISDNAEPITFSIIASKGHVCWLPDWIRSKGLNAYSYDKHIPKEYMISERSDRVKLVQGLMDTDGCVEKHGTMYFCTSSQTMAVQFKQLCNGLGYQANVHTHNDPVYTHNGEKRIGRTAYRVIICGDGKEELVTIPKKRMRVKKSRAPRQNIVSIERIGREDMQCISVSHRDSLYITDDFVVTHNTASLMNIWQTIAQQGHKSLFFSLEMPCSQLVSRLWASMGKVNLGDIRSGMLQADDWPRITAATARMKDSGLFVEDMPSLSVAKVRAIARKMKKRHGLDFIALDYLQIMGSDETTQNRTQEVTKFSQGMKAIAKELDVPVLLLSQLSRGVEMRQDKRPVMSDLRDSGAIEQDADCIMFLYRDEYYTKEQSDFKGMAELIIAKQRNGPLGTIPLNWNGPYQTFSAMSEMETARFFDARSNENVTTFKKGGFK